MVLYNKPYSDMDILCFYQELWINTHLLLYLEHHNQPAQFKRRASLMCFWATWKRRIRYQALLGWQTNEMVVWSVLLLHQNCLLGIPVASESTKSPHLSRFIQEKVTLQWNGSSLNQISCIGDKPHYFHVLSLFFSRASKSHKNPHRELRASCIITGIQSGLKF